MINTQVIYRFALAQGGVYIQVNVLLNSYCKQNITSVLLLTVVEALDWLPSSNLVIHTQKYFFLLISQSNDG